MRPPRFDTAQLSLVRTPFDDPNFLFELKHDGFRALAHIWDGNCELISRKRNVYKSFDRLRENFAKLNVQNAVIDGEIVCLDEERRSIFNELLFRRGFPIFYAFDLLYLNGRDMRQLPLIERKEKLRTLIEKSKLPDVICGKYVEGRGVDLFHEVANAHPHRFRDTLAVDMLAKGATPYDVAKTLGDTIATVEKHYAPFTKDLRERVRRILENGEGIEKNIGSFPSQSSRARNNVN